MTGDHEGARAERQDPGSEDGNPGHAFEDCRDVKMSTDVAADYLRDKRDRAGSSACFSALLFSVE